MSTNHKHNKEYIKWKKVIRRNKGLLIAGLATATAGAGVGIGYGVWHNQPKPHATTMHIEGMRDLVVPYEKEYKYACEGAELSIEGAPEGFSFNRNSGTLTFDDSKTGSLSDNGGFFYLKAVAQDGSGRIEKIRITYWKIENITTNKALFLLSNGGSQEVELKAVSNVLEFQYPTSAGVGLNLDDLKRITKSIYFSKENTLSAATIIGDDFLQSFHALTSIDFSKLPNINGIIEIKNNFLNDCRALISVNLSGFTSLHTIGDNFMSGCRSLPIIDFSKIGEVSKVGTDFLNSCVALESIDLSKFKTIKIIKTDFLAFCSSLTFVGLSKFNQVTEIEGNFLIGCEALEAVNLSGLTEVITIHQGFMERCKALENLDLSAFRRVTEIGAGFLSDCTALSSINLSGLVSLEEHSIGHQFMDYCEALTDIVIGDNGNINIDTFNINDDGHPNYYHYLPFLDITDLKNNTIRGKKAADFKKIIIDLYASCDVQPHCPLSNWKTVTN